MSHIFRGKAHAMSAPTTASPKLFAPAAPSAMGQLALRYAHSPLQLRAAENGLPPALQAGMESLSGVDMSDVQVHRDSSQPARYQARAFAKGRHIHLAPGQEQYLAHEAWHVVQQKQGRVQAQTRVADVQVNADPGLEAEAGEWGARAIHQPAIVRPALRQARLDGDAPMQRVIDGMQAYTVPANIPPEWVAAYEADILNQHMFLSEEDLFFLYDQVIGGAPDQHGFAFENTDGNHWDVRDTVNDRLYRTQPDGNCGIYAVDVVRRLMAGEVLDPDQVYDAPLETINAGRMAVQQHVQDQVADDGGAEVQQVIAATIARVNHVYATGFGPQLRQLLEHAYILQDQERRRNLFEIGYAHLYPGFKGFNFPKPSSALGALQKGDFFSAKPKSLHDLVSKGLQASFKSANSSLDFSLADEVFQKKIRRAIEMALPHFASLEEALAALKGMKSQRQFTRKPGKRKLREKFLLEREQRNKLSPKLKSLFFLRKILRASEAARRRLVNKGDMQANVKKGGRDLRKVALDNATRFAAFEGFKTSDSKQKKDLQFGLPGGGQSSFGSGGFQVKGLGTYPEEMIWFEAKLKDWKCSPADIFSAIQERDVDALMRLTRNNKSDVQHLLRFEDLQVLERWRGGPFGVGVAAFSRLGYHGQETFSGYLQNMPMRETGATTNVSETSDFDRPHDAKLWQLQEQQTLNALNRLMDMEVEPGAVYDQRTADFLNQLAEEPELGDPSDQLIEQSAWFLQSPLPYLNEDESEVVQDDEVSGSVHGSGEEHDSDEL